ICGGTVGIGSIALRVVARAAIGTVTATDGGRDHHAVALAEVAHCGSRLFHHADALMSQHGSRNHSRHGATHHVQVSSANCACGEPHDRIIRLLDLWFSNVFYTNISDSTKH